MKGLDDMNGICVLLAMLFAYVVLVPHHTTYQVTDPAPAVATVSHR